MWTGLLRPRVFYTAIRFHALICKRGKTRHNGKQSVFIETNTVVMATDRHSNKYIFSRKSFVKVLLEFMLFTCFVCSNLFIMRATALLRDKQLQQSQPELLRIGARRKRILGSI